MTPHRSIRTVARMRRAHRQGRPVLAAVRALCVTAVATAVAWSVLSPGLIAMSVALSIALAAALAMTLTTTVVLDEPQRPRLALAHEPASPLGSAQEHDATDLALRRRYRDELTGKEHVW